MTRLIYADALPKFPTMLRKMWSGGEVQKWIDENIVAHKDATMPQQVQQALTLFSEEIKQLCNDFSSRTGNVYIKDVESCLDEILKQYITNAPTVQREPDGYFYTSISGVTDYFFGAMHDDTKLLFESGDISNVKPFYFEPTNQSYDMHECQITLKNTPLYKQAYDLIQEIESLGSSLELTSAVKNASSLADEIAKREMQFHHIYKAFSELNAPTRFGEPTVQREVSVFFEDDNKEVLCFEQYKPEHIVVVLDYAKGEYVQVLRPNSDGTTSSKMYEVAPVQREGWVSVEDRLPEYGELILIYIYLPKNPIASGISVGKLGGYIEEDEPIEYGEFQRTIGCWWANGRYYHKNNNTGYVTHWQPLPAVPTDKE